MIKIKRALVSVSNKTHLDKLVKTLQKHNIEILSTGGTTKYIENLNIPVTPISKITEFPEIMDGRVKTLHPKIHAGILSRRSESDDQTTKALNISLIDLIIVNLYPFESTIAQENTKISDAIEKIDIGGPSMLRAGAKNHQHVCVVCDPDDYDALIQQIENGYIKASFSQHMATKVFFHTAWYDAQIEKYLSTQYNINKNILPEKKLICLQKNQTLRYGENHHQQACLYQNIQKTKGSNILNAQQIQGKPLSFNNIGDAQSAWQLVQRLKQPACVIVKHANPCGVAIGKNNQDAYEKAFQADPVSAFGGIIALNTKPDEQMASTILNNQFVELIIAPDFTAQAAEIFQQKPNIRLLKINTELQSQHAINYKSIEDGMLAQQKDDLFNHKNKWQISTEKKPTTLQDQMIEMAWEVVKFVKSNAIVLVNENLQTIGIGAGQTSRIESVNIAIEKAKKIGFQTQGSIAASDGFFPFPDSIEKLAKAEIKGVIQPGGSIKDNDVIQTANQHHLFMVLTHKRHFLH